MDMTFIGMERNQMAYYDDGKGNGWDHARNRSVNAVEAENNGFFPKSVWRGFSARKLSDVLATCYCLSDEAHRILESMSRAQFIRELEYKGFHHVGQFKKAVEYYGLPEKWEDL